jgi:hypothetical protein
MSVTRTPVRIVGHELGHWYDRVVSHEATAYSGDSPTLNRLVRLSDEGNAVCPGRRRYLRVEEVTVEPIERATEKVFL